jgi:hypothetical protein
MKKLLAPFLFVVLWLGMTPVPALAATPNVGQHVHAEFTNHPVDGYPIPQAKYTFHTTIRLHNQTGPLRWYRVDSEDVTGTQTKLPVQLGPCADCSWTGDLVFDFSKWSKGRHEIRWHFDVSPNDDGNRQFTSSRIQICIVDCNSSSSGRPTPYSGGSSWYLGKYATVTLRSKLIDVRPGNTITISFDQNAEGGCAFVNPDFHHNSSGTKLGCWTGLGKKLLTLPSTLVPGDNLLLVATQANGNGGVFHIKVSDGIARSTTYYEVQSWWAKGGIVFP